MASPEVHGALVRLSNLESRLQDALARIRTLEENYARAPKRPDGSIDRADTQA